MITVIKKLVFRFVPADCWRKRRIYRCNSARPDEEEWAQWPVDFPMRGTASLLYAVCFGVIVCEVVKEVARV